MKLHDFRVNAILIYNLVEIQTLEFGSWHDVYPYSGGLFSSGAIIELVANNVCLNGQRMILADNSDTIGKVIEDITKMSFSELEKEGVKKSLDIIY